VSPQIVLIVLSDSEVRSCTFICRTEAPVCKYLPKILAWPDRSVSFWKRYSRGPIEAVCFGKPRRGLAGGCGTLMENLENVEFKGKSLVVTKSSQSSTGYKNVIKLRTDELGPIYVAKFKVEGESGQRNCPKSYSRSPQEAAAALAYFEAGYLGAMPTKKDYAVRRTTQVCARIRFVLCVFSHLVLVACATGSGEGERGASSSERAAEGGEGSESSRGAAGREAAAGVHRPQEAQARAVDRGHTSHGDCVGTGGRLAIATANGGGRADSGSDWADAGVQSECPCMTVTCMQRVHGCIVVVCVAATRRT
jgi:hypothetical protein